MKTVDRKGRFYRVCDPAWDDCCDATYAARFGGRWNPPNSFPVLYLCADIETARRNARRAYEGEAFGLYDLNPGMRPHLQVVDVRPCKPIDAITPAGLRALGLTAAYPKGVGHDVCRKIGRRVHDAGHCGIACRSAARPGGEELALMEPALATKQQRLAFDQWFEKEP